MKKSQFYSLCLETAKLEENPIFKVKVGKTDKTINPYFIPSKIQRYYYETIIERISEPQIIIECYFNQKIKATGKIKFESKQTQMISQKVQLIETNKTKLTQIFYSLRKIEKKVKKPSLKIELVQASYLQNRDIVGKMDPFVVVKHGDANYKSKTAEGQGQTPLWKQIFKSADSDIDRIYIQSWEEDAKDCQYIGVTIIDINKNLNSQKEYDVKQGDKKVGSIKIGIYESQKLKMEEKAINDKNIIRKRSIKVYAVQAILKKEQKKGIFIKLLTSEQQFETTPLFVQYTQLKWNQSFIIVSNQQNEMLRVKLCIKDQIEEQIAQSQLQISKITNKRYELSLKDGSDAQVGKLYLEFYDQQIDIKQEIKGEEKVEQKANQKINQEKKEAKTSLSKEQIQINQSKTSEIKNRYSGKQSIHDYMSNLNVVLQQGMLKIAKQRPQDPVRELGLFLINYKKP